MASIKDSFLDLERHVIQLEANVKELKSSLEHWRMWDAEYEALKEEVSAASRDGAREAAMLTRVREGFEGDLVKRKEIIDIFGGKAQRSAGQVIGVLDRRLDYVGTNVRTLEKRLAEAERKLDAARVVSDPGATDEGGLPITEIFESLDEEGNVISHELWTPGSKKPQVEELLGKVEATDGSARKTEAEEVQSEAIPGELTTQDERQPSDESPSAPESKPTAPIRQGKPPARPEKEKKTITQAEAGEPPESSQKPEISKSAQRVQRIMDNAREQEELSKSQPVIPEGESEEDAALRQQMLDYGMSHSAGGMGEVVAVMNDLRFEDSDDDDEFNSFSEADDSEEDDGDSEEDQWGRTKKLAVSEKYQGRMLELEQRLGVQSRFTRKLAENATADEDEEKDDNYQEGIGKITIKDTEAATDATPKKSARDAEPPVNGVLKSNGVSKLKKSVRFAGSLDIAPDDVKPEPKSENPGPKRPETQNPVADLIVEQTGPQKSEPPAVTEAKPRKASRFKQLKSDAAKAAATQVPTQETEERKPTEESGIMEDLSWTETVPEKDLDGDVDDEISRREVADEYQRRRRRMIEKQGGFLQEDKSEVQKEGRTMSKFRAARLSRQ